MTKMKAVLCTKYGKPEDVLKIDEVQKPIPKENEILVKIMASAVNSADVRVRGLAVEGIVKVIMRFVLGFNKPRKPILGVVFAGIIVKTGKNVTHFKLEDKVYGTTGFKFSAHAEYISVNEKSVVSKKPDNATFEEAAALPFGGTSAIYFLEKAKIKEKTNPKILIYGATGAVGTAAIQIAQHYNAQITAVCSEQGQNLVNELGVENVILYNKEDFTKTQEKFDIVFDAVGKTTKKQCTPLLKKGGSYATVGGIDVAKERKEQLEFLKTLFETQKYKAVIDKIYPMNDIVQAYQYVDTGRKKGNVVLKIAE